MKYDRDKIDDAVLALLHLTSFDDRGVTRAWKSHAWEVLHRLHERGLISDPKSKAKSVIVTAEGVKRSGTLFRELFGESG